MTFFTGLIIGLIVGWVIEWIIDWFFWRRDDEQVRQKLAACQDRIKSLEAELAAKPQPAAAPVPRQEDPLENISGIGPEFAKRLKSAGIYTFLELTNQTPARIREIIAPEEWQKVDTESWVAEARKIVGLAVDPLEEIIGIGPTFAKRFNTAGIFTFADLANLTPKRVREIISPEEWQKIEPEKWIAEAGQISQTSDET